MIIELYHLSNADMPEMRRWLVKNSPNSKLLIGFISNIDGCDFIETWKKTEWVLLDHTVNYNIFYDKILRWAVDVPNKDAVYFKLVWG